METPGLFNTERVFPYLYKAPCFEYTDEMII